MRWNFRTHSRWKYEWRNLSENIQKQKLQKMHSVIEMADEFSVLDLTYFKKKEHC